MSSSMLNLLLVRRNSMNHAVARSSSSVSASTSSLLLKKRRSVARTAVVLARRTLSSVVPPPVARIEQDAAGSSSSRQEEQAPAHQRSSVVAGIPQHQQRRVLTTQSFFSCHAAAAAMNESEDDLEASVLSHLLKTRLQHKEQEEMINERAKHLRVLLLSNSFNSMTQRAYLELKEKYGQDVRVEIAIDEKQMLNSVQRHDPHVILCPFLTKKIPQEIYQDSKRLCLIVHPGIHGDRGASSIDWALKESSEQWGVTVLQADDEMDAGPIWSTKNFVVPEGSTKSNLYGSLVVDHAMEAIHETIKKIVTGQTGIPLDYSDPSVKGTLRPNMKLKDRSVDFYRSAHDVANQIRFSDSSPGAPFTFSNEDGEELCKVFMYNAQVEESKQDGDTNFAAAAGTITGKRSSNGAVRMACGDGSSIWVSHMKGRGKDTTLPRIKLPACDVLPSEVLEGVPEIDSNHFFYPETMSSTQQAGLDLWCDFPQDAPGVAVLQFPFLNGAMSTNQCERVTQLLRDVSRRDDVKAIVLAGGPSAWSNGINLNTIEASDDPAAESWANINAMNDFVKEIFSIKDKVTIAALQGNAGAGGFMTALVCDLVWSHSNVVVNPHYKSMGLHGSEYWTHFLPQRLAGDHNTAQELTEQCLPVSASRAHKLGLVDDVLTNDRASFMNQVMTKSQRLIEEDDVLSALCSSKTLERNDEWFDKLEQIRSNELAIMRENFVSCQYQTARRNFVHKKSPTATPLHLSIQHLHDPALNQEEGEDSDYASSIKSTSSPAVSMNGRKLAKTCNDGLVKRIQTLKEEYSSDKSPSLAVLLVRGNDASEKYVAQKVKTASKVDIETTVYEFQQDKKNQLLEDELIKTIQALNQDSNVNGIMVQLPLPQGVNKHRVLGTVCALKDVDGFNASNMGAIFGGSLSSGETAPTMIPCTAKAILKLLDNYQVPLTGKRVCIVGRSCIVGLPTQLLMMKRGATVTNCDCNTTDLKSHIKEADIVVAAAGVPELIKASWIKRGAVVIDVGFHLTSSSLKVVGDVEADVASTASLVTPVPGGVGPMTVSCLMENTVDAFEYQQKQRHQQEEERRVA